MMIRTKGKNHKLLLSAHPQYARVQLTREEYENPAIPHVLYDFKKTYGRLFH